MTDRAAPAERPLRLLGIFAEEFGYAWSGIEALRRSRGRDGLPNWPSWCFIPIAGGIAAVTGGADLASADLTPDERADIASKGAVAAALAAWRMTKGVYRFDQDLLEALWSTPVTGDIPSQLLRRLPEWCVYVTVGREVPDDGLLHGAWAHLEFDVNETREELRFLLDFDAGWRTASVHLGGSLTEGLDRMIAHSARYAPTPLSQADAANVKARFRRAVEPLLSLLLWLCSEQPEIEGRGRPGNPRPVRTKRGVREFPAPGPRTWEVGARVGAALRAARDAAKRAEGEATGRRVRPHVRRAHWHTFWTGPRSGEQTPSLRWLNPILVGGGDVDELPAVVRRVE